MQQKSLCFVGYFLSLDVDQLVDSHRVQRIPTHLPPPRTTTTTSFLLFLLLEIPRNEKSIKKNFLKEEKKKSSQKFVKDFKLV